MGLTQFNLSKNICFYKYAHNSGPKGSRDMILTAFDMKFDEKKDELPPQAWNPQTKIKKTQKTQKNATRMGPPESSPARPLVRGVRGAAAPWEYPCV